MRLLLLLAAACSLVGCIYVGGRNHAPSGAVTIVSPDVTSPQRCGTVILQAEASDPDADPLTFAWRVSVESTEAEAPGSRELTAADGPYPCPGHDLSTVVPAGQGRLVGSADQLTLSRLPARGLYTVLLTISDPLGAVATASTSFEVVNQKPQITTLRIDPDPEVKTDRIPDGLEFGGGNPAHGHYVAWVVEAADPDDVLTQGASWEPVGLAASAFEYWEVVAAQPRYPRGLLRFRLRPEQAIKQTLTLRALLDDGHGGKADRTTELALVGNRAPCIRDAIPALVKDPTTAPLAQPVIVLHSDGRRFESAALDDDVFEGAIYTWSIKDEGSSSGFVTLPGETGSAFDLPAWYRPPGARLELRAAVRDLSGAAANSCSAETKHCKLSSECYGWVTWGVEFQ